MSAGKKTIFLFFIYPWTWAEEDFEYEEVDKNDEIERIFFCGAVKKEARLKRKGKKTEKSKTD